MEHRYKIAQEIRFDFPQTSSLACRAFGKQIAELSAKRFEWSYLYGYNQVTVISAFDGDKKVGQAASIEKNLQINRSTTTASELVDLFVDPDCTNFRVLSGIYQALRAEHERKNIEYIYTFPNAGAFLLNKRFFKLKEIEYLPISLGVSIFPRILGRSRHIEIVRNTCEIAKKHQEMTRAQNVIWTQDELERRLGSPIYDYAYVTDGNIGLLVSPRKIRGVRVLLICATACYNIKTAKRADLNRIIRHSCSLFQHSIYGYVGWNDDFPLKIGVKIPNIFRKNRYYIQSNFLTSQKKYIGKFEAIDFDYG